MIGAISLIMFVMWLLLIYAIHNENDIFIFIAGCGLIIISIFIMVNGLEGLDNFVTKGFAVIQIGVGFMAIFAPIFNLNKWGAD